MKYFKDIPPRADFAYQQLVGPCRMGGAEMASARTYFGLILNKTIPNGCLRDEEGEIYAVVRSLLGPNGTPNPTNFVYQSTRVDGKTLRMDKPRMAAQGSTMKPALSLDGDTARWTSQPGDPGASWEVTASSKLMTWTEAGLLDVTGTVLGTAYQWYLPGVDWGTYYTSQGYDVSGICEGRRVKGVIFIDQPYLAEGGAVHFQKDLIVNNKKHVIWWNFANVYADGSFDIGSFCVGHDNLGYAIFQNEKGEIRTTTNIEGNVIHRPGSYFCDHAEIIIEGEEIWEFTPDPKGDMVDFVGGFPITAQQEGLWRRKGDTRVPARSSAWGETDRRNGSARNVLGADLPEAELELKKQHA
jgi:hypothetical protein